ncbi:mitochondrial import inner membrane translocase subunit TIM50-C-like [Cylas formicarius]|uniref:mitochondrial import inner membrane translocase subunit TIM50-C-like n=1 Tax=Cylas formicarius TaxID=197179 RepID=UPI002958D48A|nr:mitochondrial import inner membrane translocase subunit TIM50-C-like [Cylas formicarius]
MFRLPLSSLGIISLIKQRPILIIRTKGRRTFSEIAPTFLGTRLYSNDFKSNTPLGSILINTKDQVDANKEKVVDDEETKKQRERSWRTMKITLWVFGISFTCIGTYCIISFGAPQKDSNGIPIRDEFSDKPILKAYLMRTFKELEYYRRLIKEPSRDKLLPDPVQYPYIQPKYTLVLELTDVLVHPDWTYNTGWRFKKRPHLDYFLESLKDQFEIVIYTAEQGMTVFPLIEAIDPKNLIAYKLVRDATHFTGGHHVKSLNNLNRDLSKVICIDWNENNLQFNKENLFHIKRWIGNDDDAILMDLVNFLKTIAMNDIEDVREVLKVYSTFDDPIEAFREKQKRFAYEIAAQEEAKKEQEKSRVSRWSPTFLKRSF